MDLFVYDAGDSKGSLMDYINYRVCFMGLFVYDASDSKGRNRFKRIKYLCSPRVVIR
jgi:hypothetical protein